MADEQKVREAFEAYGRSKGWRMDMCPEFPGEYDWAGVQNHWECWQAALSHASATGKENLTVGEAVDDQAFASFVEKCAKLLSGAPFPSARSYAKAREICDLALHTFSHPPRAAEDATGWREMDSAPADKAIMGAWFGSPEYTEVSPVIYCSERGTWMNPDDMRDDEYTKPDMWHPYPSAPPYRAIDQAMAGKRGG